MTGLISTLIMIACLAIYSQLGSTSVITSIFDSKIQGSITKEQAISDQIWRYRALKGVYPSSMNDLVAAGMWVATDNNNGFGNPYSFTVNSTNGTIVITTVVPDAQAKAQYLSHYKNVWKPVDIGNNTLQVTTILPSNSVLAALPGNTSSAVVSSAQPDASSNTYWWNTSGSTPVLEISNGTSWSVAQSTSSGSGVAAPSAANMVSSTGSLPATGNVGDVRYVYSNGSISEYIYTPSGWALQAVGSGTLNSTPNAFSFTSATGVTISTQTTSNTITISGISTSAALSISGTGSNLLCSINSAALAACPSSVTNGTTIAVAQTSSSSYSTSTTAILTVGGVSSTFTVTTGSNPFNTSTGYAAHSLVAPSVGANYSGTCATGFIPVPAMTIPTGSGGTQTVPAHCVMQYIASPSNTAASSQSVAGGSYTPTFRASNATYQPTSRAEGFTLTDGSAYKPKSDSNGKPWVYISMYEAQAACNAMGTAPNGAQIRLQRESEWMAEAHNVVGMASNWSGGAVDSGNMWQGVNSNPSPYSSSGAQAASVGALAGTSDQRTKTLTTGGVIWDLGGNVYQWTYHDMAGAGSNGLFGNITAGQTAAPYDSTTRGMGWIPDSGHANSGYPLPYSGWSGGAPIRGGYWASTSYVGPFNLSNSTPASTGGSNVGFRCTHQ